MADASFLPPPAGAGANVRRPPLPARARRKRQTSNWIVGPVATPVAAWVLIGILIIAHQGRLLELVFTPLMVAVSFWLYRRYPAHYLSMVLWLFFLSPEVRRFADYYNGTFNPTSMIMVAPLAAPAICGLSMILHYRLLSQRRVLPLVLMLMATLYGYVIGIIQFGVQPATFTLSGWLLPIFIAWHMMLTWREYPVYQRVLSRTFVYGTFVMGAYGVYQYISPPPWTVFWLLSSGMGTSSGEAVAFGMRICSTMNSTGPFALTIMAGLLMSIASPGRMKIVAGAAGIPALMFTSVRTAWAGIVIGLVYPLAMLDAKSRVRLIMTAVCLAGLCTPVVMLDQVSGPLLRRLSTLENLQDDNSFRSRSGFYTNFGEIASASFAGHGLGSTGLAAKLAPDNSQMIASVDSGIVDMLWVLGWPGSLLYVAGVFMLLWRAFLSSLARPADRFAISGVGVAISIIAIMVIIDTLQGEPGMLFMIGVLMPAIGVRYARSVQQSAPGRPKNPYARRTP